MSTPTLDLIASNLPSLGDAPLDADVSLDGDGYAQIMRGAYGGDAKVPVSAFNSSI